MRKLTSTLIALTAGAVTAQAQDLSLKYSIAVPQNNIVSEGNQYLADKAKELSGGKINIQIFWSGSLGKQDEMLPMLKGGVVDLATLVTSQVPETPLMAFMNTIFPVFQNAEQLLGISHHLYENSKGMQAELELIEARPLMLQHLPSYHLLCKEPLKTVADFKGVRIRSYGAYLPLMWQSVGAIPVNVVNNEMYDGLSRGVIDCTFLPASIIESLKLYEVAKNFIDVPFGKIEFAPTLVSNVQWNSWTEAQRAVLLEAAKQAEAFSLKNTEEKSEQALKSLLDKGVTLVKFEETDKLMSRLPDLMQAWLDRQTSEGRGEAAKEIVDYVRGELGKS